MTTTHRASLPTAPTTADELRGDPRPRTALDLASRQLLAIEQFNRARHQAEQVAAVTARSRELRMDSARRLEVLRREHQALVAHAHEQLRLTGDVLQARPQRRVVLAHRNEWFLGKVADALQARGVVVVAHLDNGADTVGLAVAEQPDLMLVEDTLAMVPGEQVVREVRDFCPHTLVVAQVAHSDRVEALLEAGAAAVFTRHAPPLDVALGMHALLAA